MEDASTTGRFMYADPEHGGIRIVVLASIGLGCLIGFFLIRYLLAALFPGSPILDYATFLSCVGAVPLALGFAFLVERLLKRRWKSGQRFQLSERELRFDGAQLADGSMDALVLDWNKRVNLTRWYFRVGGYPKAGRERQVSDKWLCLACQMQQDETRLIAYTYCSPEFAQAWLDGHSLGVRFHEISLSQLYRAAGKRPWGATTRPDVPPDLVAGSDGRYWIAERRRWTEGLELTPADFAELTSYVESQIQVAEP